MIVSALTTAMIAAAILHPETVPAVERAIRADSCAIVVGSEIIVGKRVSEAELTFCVPSDWERTGARTWQGAGSIRWDLRALAVAPRPVKRPRVGSLELQRAPWSEDVGGKTVDFAASLVDAGRWRTSASWNGVLTFVGDAPNATAKDVQLAIFRSVRLLEP